MDFGTFFEKNVIFKKKLKKNFFVKKSSYNFDSGESMKKIFQKFFSVEKNFSKINFKNRSILKKRQKWGLYSRRLLPFRAKNDEFWHFF